MATLTQCQYDMRLAVDSYGWHAVLSALVDFSGETYHKATAEGAEPYRQVNHHLQDATVYAPR